MQNRIIRRLCFVFALMVSTLAVMLRPCIPNTSGLEWYANFLSVLRQALGTVELAHVLAVVFLGLLYRRVFFLSASPFCVTAFVLAFLFALFLVIGFSFSEFNSFAFLMANQNQLLLSASLFIGYMCILYATFKWLITCFDRRKEPPAALPVHMQWINRHLTLVCILTMVICWAAVWGWFFPGSVPHDAQNQLNQFFGYMAFSNHHPYLSSYLMGWIVKVGEWFGSYRIGVLLYVVLQSITAIAVFTAICKYQQKKGMPLVYVLLTLGYFSLAPMFGGYMQAVVKDTLFMSVFAWFALECVKQVLDPPCIWNTVRLFLSALLVCVLRNNGMYVALFAWILLTVLARSSKRCLWIGLVGLVACNILVQGPLMDALGIQPGSVKEAMSIPFQCTARYVRDYGDELDESEKTIIDQILPYNRLAANYRPELSDPIKNSYRSQATEDDWSAYWKLWFEKLTERPDAYLEAFMNHAYGYLDPFYLYEGMGTYQTYNKGRITDNPNEPLYSIYEFSASARAIGTEYGALWKKVPVLSFFISPASYMWMSMILIALLLRKKQFRMAALCLVLLVYFLCCIASPVNGFLRYALPVMAAMPVFMTGTWFVLNENTKLTEG